MLGLKEKANNENVLAAEVPPENVGPFRQDAPVNIDINTGAAQPKKQ